MLIAIGTEAMATGCDLFECHALITDRPYNAYRAFKDNHRLLPAVASQQACAIIFGFIHIRDFARVTNLRNKSAVGLQQILYFHITYSLFFPYISDALSEKYRTSIGEVSNK